MLCNYEKDVGMGLCMLKLFVSHHPYPCFQVLHLVCMLFGIFVHCFLFDIVCVHQALPLCFKFELGNIQYRGTGMQIHTIYRFSHSLIVR